MGVRITPCPSKKKTKQPVQVGVHLAVNIQTSLMFKVSLIQIRKLSGLFKTECWPILVHNPCWKATTKGTLCVTGVTQGKDLVDCL